MFNFLEIQFKTQLQIFVHLQFQMSLHFILGAFVLHMLLHLWYKKYSKVFGNGKNYVLYCGIY